MHLITLQREYLISTYHQVRTKQHDLVSAHLLILAELGIQEVCQRIGITTNHMKS